MIPVIALVGRPNVGKSTLFNRLTRSRDALVADFPGLTRDRKYGEGKMGNRDYIVVDTGGISGDEDGIDTLMADQSLQAIDEADVVLFLVDARSGLTAADEMIVHHLRQQGKKAWLVVNKIDGLDPDIALAEFYGLGMEHDPRPIAAAHGRGVRSLIETVLAGFPVPEEAGESEAEGTDAASQDVFEARIAIVGRPNVGKSTLVNRILGEERVVVYDHPGTTRDSIEIPYERDDRQYTLVDTAGIRRRKNVTEVAEKFSIIKTLQSISDANVVIMVLNAREGVVEQDLHLLNYVLESGRALVLAVNKWDGMTPDAKDKMKADIQRRLGFADFAQLHFISALHGTGVGELYRSVDQAHASAFAKWPTSRLTRILQDAVQEHQPPLVRGRRIKLRYAHQGGSNPPIIVVHGNQTDALPESYKRYLTNLFRKILKIKGTPIRLEFRSGDNPYDSLKGKDSRTQAKKRRLQRDAEYRTGKKR